ncbi:phage major capsid protein [Streptomyces agglomeratus]|uniref:phage major capsid protein n=1 Tax=Streptomyces agglomeratus TaxID=285458 RepID=UPI0009A05AEC|nr:phage major capsid protein [Streptomyces agglomeratus]
MPQGGLRCIPGHGNRVFKGLISLGATTNLPAGATANRWDDVHDAYAAIEAAGATPGVIFASPDQAKALRKARENGTSGAYLAGTVTDPAAVRGLGLPIHVSANIPARHVIVADPSRIHMGARSEVRVAMSEHMEFDKDVSVYRIAGLAIAETASVQILKAAAS